MEARVQAHQVTIPLLQVRQVLLMAREVVAVVLVAIIHLPPLPPPTHPQAPALPHRIVLQLQVILHTVEVLLPKPAVTQIRFRIMITLPRPNAKLPRALVHLELQRPEVLAVGRRR